MSNRSRQSQPRQVRPRPASHLNRRTKISTSKLRGVNLAGIDSYDTPTAARGKLASIRLRGRAPTRGSLPESMWRAKLGLGSMHRIAQYTDSGDFYFDSVARDQRAYTGWRAGGDDITG